jgi:UDP-glucose 4-epimerase
MKKVIVFGGAGFLGSHVVDCLCQEGYPVTVFDINESAYLNKKARFIKGNINDKDVVEKAVAGHDIVYHYAGVSDIDEAAEKPYETICTNVIGTANILEACRKHSVSRFIFASSIYVYSNSGLFYRSTKQACELIIENYQKKYGLSFTILRYGSLYGPRSDRRNTIYRFLSDALENGRIIRFGDGNEIREYIHILDAAHLSVRILDDKYREQYVIISGNQQIKVRDLLLMISEMLENKVELEFKDATVEGHYEITPYNFSPRLAKKITDGAHVDLGQGILDLLNSIYTGSKSKQSRAGKAGSVHEDR